MKVHVVFDWRRVLGYGHSERWNNVNREIVELILIASHHLFVFIKLIKTKEAQESDDLAATTL